MEESIESDFIKIAPNIIVFLHRNMLNCPSLTGKSIFAVILTKAFLILSHLSSFEKFFNSSLTVAMLVLIKLEKESKSAFCTELFVNNPDLF